MTVAANDRSVLHDGIELFARLRVVDPGAPTVILLCGLGFHTFEYEPLAEELAERRVNTVSFDYRGHGRSSGDRGRWSLDDLTSDARAVVADAGKHGLSAVHVVGNSLGGMIAIRAAIHNSAVVSVVASNTPARAADFLLTRPRRALYRVATPVSRLLPLRISVNHFYRYDDLTSNAALAERIRHDPLITAARRLSIATYRELLDEWDGLDEIRRLQQPLMLIDGTADQLQPRDQTRLLFEAANEPKCWRHLPTGHLPHLDRTVDFADLITSWITRPRVHGTPEPPTNRGRSTAPR